jgi:excisionase family DNA binding protein
MTRLDYATWLTKQQAAEAIGVTTKTIERLAQDGQVQQARWRRPAGGPAVAVYQPDDVARIARARQRDPLPPFLVPATGGPANGNGSGEGSGLAIVPPTLPSTEDLLRVLLTSAARAMSQTSETVSQTSTALFLTIPEAATVSGLSQACLRRMIADGTLTAIRDRGWRIRRKDLEQL